MGSYVAETYLGDHETLMVKLYKKQLEAFTVNCFCKKAPFCNNFLVWFLIFLCLEKELKRSKNQLYLSELFIF